MKPTLPFLIIKAMQIIYLINPRPSLISPHHLKGDLTKSDKCTGVISFMKNLKTDRKTSCEETKELTTV